MKVAFIIRSTLYAVPGGDTVQATQTAEHLIALGIDVDIKLTTEHINYEEYDLLHFFNLIRPADILYHSQRSGKPFVISTILVNYSEYDKYHRSGVSSVIRYFSSDTIEYLKTLARCMVGGDRLASLSYILRGQRNSIMKVLRHASAVLPNSESEYRRLIGTYPCTTPCQTVTNGVNTELFGHDSKIEKDENLVLCVARIEGVKNQINLIKALNGSRFKLLIIGGYAPNQLAYYQHCRELAGPNVTFMGHIRQNELRSYYQRAKVHILPSWFETTGLSSLEAAVSGCNIVITDRGDAKEYFGQDAFYCDPASPSSIIDSISRAAEAPVSPLLRERIVEHYTWKHAANQTLRAYKQVVPTIIDFDYKPEPIPDALSVISM